MMKCAKLIKRKNMNDRFAMGAVSENSRVPAVTGHLVLQFMKRHYIMHKGETLND